MGFKPSRPLIIHESMAPKPSLVFSPASRSPFLASFPGIVGCLSLTGYLTSLSLFPYMLKKGGSAVNNT